MTYQNFCDFSFRYFGGFLMTFSSRIFPKVEHLKVSLSKVDPSDCVDMDCDGRRKIIIEDHDNSFFKKSEPTTLISKSEVEWSGDGYTGNTKYGLGKLLLCPCRVKCLRTFLYFFVLVQFLSNYHGYVRFPSFWVRLKLLLQLKSHIRCIENIT